MESKIRIPSTTAVSIYDGDYGDDTEETEEDHEAVKNILSGKDKDGKAWSFGRDAKIDRKALEQEIDTAQIILDKKRRDLAQRRKWLASSRIPVRQRILDGKGRAYGRGGRKTATAQVWLFPGLGNITVNSMDFVDYFPRESHRESVLMPFVATETCGMYDVLAFVNGGGVSGQAGAVRHGIARALQNFCPDLRLPMKKLGLMTRDPRMVERKKPGLKKARKAKQWVKR